jgi:dihydropteroate synthase
MGIINTTPDSFFPQSRKQQIKEVVQFAREMVEEGASILDIGGESSRPGAKSISIEEELDRVIPAIEAISKEIDVILSVDTRKSHVAEAAIKAGAQMINDISAMQFDSRMIDFVCLNQLPIVVMHMQGEPENMQDDPEYQDVVSEIVQFFQQKIQLLQKKGLQRKRIILDPGIGFGKTVRNNLQIINHLETFQSLGYPLMMGSSRKSFIGSVLGQKDPQERLAGTLATTVLGVMKGVHIFRVHDVQENFDAIHMAFSIGKETCDDVGFVKGGRKE